MAKDQNSGQGAQHHEPAPQQPSSSINAQLGISVPERPEPPAYVMSAMRFDGKFSGHTATGLETNPLLEFLRAGGNAAVFKFLGALAIRVAANKDDGTQENVAKMLRRCAEFSDSFNIVHTLKTLTTQPDQHSKQFIVQASALATGDLMDLVEQPEKFSEVKIGRACVEKTLFTILKMHQQGFIHSDLKAENMLFHLDDDKKNIKLVQLCDFGDLEDVALLQEQWGKDDRYFTHRTPGNLWTLTGYPPVFTRTQNQDQDKPIENSELIVAQKMLNELWAFGLIVEEVFLRHSQGEDLKFLQDLSAILYPGKGKDIFNPTEAVNDLHQILDKLKKYYDAEQDVHSVAKDDSDSGAAPLTDEDATHGSQQPQSQGVQHTHGIALSTVDLHHQLLQFYDQRPDDHQAAQQRFDKVRAKLAQWKNDIIEQFRQDRLADHVDLQSIPSSKKRAVVQLLKKIQSALTRKKSELAKTLGSLRQPLSVSPNHKQNGNIPPTEVGQKKRSLIMPSPETENRENTSPKPVDGKGPPKRART